MCVQLDVMIRRQFDPSFSPSVGIPELRTSATGMALTMGVFANMRYQLLGGIDRYLFDHSNFLLPYLGMSIAFRAVSTWYGQETRLHLQVRQLLHCFLSYTGPFLYWIGHLFMGNKFDAGRVRTKCACNSESIIYGSLSTSMCCVQGLPVKSPTHVYKQRMGPGMVIREQLPPARTATTASGTVAPRKAKKRATASKGFEMSATLAAAH